jgi:hypothetical protein
MKNFFEHFKTTIYSEFDFLKNFGFNDFEEEEIAYEYHIVAKSSNNIVIDFQIEMISSTPIWITINGIHLEKIFDSHPIFKNDKMERDGLYKGNFDQFLNSDNSQFLKNNQERFVDKGFMLNENYLIQVKNLLIENIEFLQDPAIYSDLQEKVNRKSKLALAEYYKPFKKLFDKNRKIVIDEDSFKAQFDSHLFILETDKITVEFNSYDEFKEFFISFPETEIDHENIIYKFEPK